MKHVKQSFIKRALAFILCTVLVFSTVFLSYENTMIVKAVDVADLLTDAICVAAASVGLVFTGATAPAVAAALIPLMANEGKDVYHYLTDNGDGTTTISEDFVQLVLQAYGQYREENAELFGGEMYPDAFGYYNFGTVSGTYIYEPLSELNYTRTFSDIKTKYPCALLVYNNRPQAEGSSNRLISARIIFYIESDDMFYAPAAITPTSVQEGDELYLDDFGQAPDGYCYVEQPKFVTKYINSGRVVSGSTYYVLGMNASGGLPSTASLSVSSSSMPVYHDLASLKNGLRTHDFSLAYNYGKNPDCESSKYTGSYSGGDITVDNEKLEGIQDKLDEINETGKDIDDKLGDLIDWLIGGGSGSGSGGFGGWLEKIYDKLCDILSQLKSIKRWTVVNTIVNGVDAMADWLDLIHDILSDADDGLESAVSTLSSALDDATGLLKTKFPFSVPWDIFFFVTLLAAEPEVPHFEVPIDFDVSALDMQIHYDFVLDFSDYQYLSDISRVILSMTYAVGLMKLTAGIANTKKEE